MYVDLFVKTLVISKLIFLNRRQLALLKVITFQISMWIPAAFDLTIRQSTDFRIRKRMLRPECTNTKTPLEQ